MPAFRSLELLRKITEADIRCIVVGGVAGALFGSRWLTDDLDLVYEKSDANHERLLRLLTSLGAIFRGTPGRTVVPTHHHLEVNRVTLLKTSLGHLDLLPTIGDGWTYEDLLPHSRWLPIQDFQVRVLRLEKLIESKKIADRPQDRAALPMLEELLARDADRDPET